MGIKDLWPILGPYCERKPLYELEGKIVAIDLAGWICESMCVVNYEVQPRFYLRNLYFRTCYLLLSGVTPVFVLEGDAPKLKYDVISKRNDIQFKGAKPKQQTQQYDKENFIKERASNKGRTRFNFVLKQCENLLNNMGIQCVQATGEAEAYCAYMNKEKLVDAIISQDSDCFAYGAEVVYRNFSISNQKSSTQSGSVDVYNINRIRQSIDLGQNKIIAMALLCGCDYCPEGVDGVGKDTALKLFQCYGNEEILNRLKTWRSNPKEYTDLQLKIENKTICINCGHAGRSQNHTKNGCTLCNRAVGCDSTLWKEQRNSLKVELQIRKKALLISNFPSQEIINEFLKKPSELPKLDLKWKQPNLINFLKLMCNLLQWNEIYCFQKFLPLLTRWQCIHNNYENDLKLYGCISPKFIKKKRVPKGISSYEIIWQDDQNYFSDLIPADQIKSFLDENQSNIEILWSTIEPCDIFERAYPNIVKQFLSDIDEKKLAKKKPKTTRGSKRNVKITDDKLKSPDNQMVRKKKSKKSSKSIDDNNSLNNMSGILEAIENIDRSIKPKKSKKVLKQHQQPSIQRIDNFFITNKTRQANSRKLTEINDGPLNLSEFSFDLNNDDNLHDHIDVSKIIETIVTRSPDINELNGNPLRFDKIKIDGQKSMTNSVTDGDGICFNASPSSSTPIIIKKFFNKYNLNFKNSVENVKDESSIKYNNPIETSEEKHTSYFFDNLTNENDEFEKSINFNYQFDSDDD